MDINLTILGEFITFGVLVLVTMRFIWPPLRSAMEERQRKIASGLEAAARGEKDLILAKQQASENLRAAQVKATNIIQHANQEIEKMIEMGKVAATKESEKIIALTRANLEKEKITASETLKKETTNIVLQAIEKILKQKIDATANQKLIDDFIQELEAKETK
jgi:F-type H+-transporting ATPase subunit b